MGTSVRRTIPAAFVVGVLLLGVISNMLTMLGIESYIQGVVKGCIIIAAVLIQRGRRTV